MWSAETGDTAAINGQNRPDGPDGQNPGKLCRCENPDCSGKCDYSCDSTVLNRPCGCLIGVGRAGVKDDIVRAVPVEIAEADNLPVSGDFPRISCGCHIAVDELGSELRTPSNYDKNQRFQARMMEPHRDLTNCLKAYSVYKCRIRRHYRGRPKLPCLKGILSVELRRYYEICIRFRNSSVSSVSLHTNPY